MTDRHSDPQDPIVIIGAGPGGLTTAKALLDEGLEVVLLEASGGVGGQWNCGSAHSGVWAGMPTNTSKATTVFSDLAHEAGVAMFPLATDIGAYLRRYAAQFEIERRVVTGARVSSVARRAGGGFVVCYRDASGEHQLAAGKVVVASGRCNKPKMPDQIPGLREFTGRGGLHHAFDYEGAESFRGMRVLTLGNSVSGLEIASALAQDRGVQVVSSCRKPRYIIQKVADGIASDWRFFNRAAAAVGRTLPPARASAGLRDQVLRLHGNPGDQGAPRPSDNLMEAGLAQCQHYLALCSEGRIATRGAPVRVDGAQVTFQDGTCETFDAIICATGYQLDLPYLSAELGEALGVDSENLDLFNYTFSPVVDGLAFVGQFMMVGPYFPVLELQGRWIAMVFAGIVPLAAADVMTEGARQFRTMRELGVPVVFHDVAIDVAAAAGVEPSPASFPELAAGLMFGPIVPAQFRLTGHRHWDDGAARLHSALGEVGLDARPPVAPEQVGLLRMLADHPQCWPAARQTLEVLDEQDARV